jgi:uncharacterized protein (TIGR03083 family)
MYLTVDQCLDAINRHTRGLAASATGQLDASIEHCPGWSMADLVWHLIDVHWFWNEIASTLPAEQPKDLVRPKRPADDQLVPSLLAGVDRLVDTLRRADQDARCWTWGLDENVGFITRHQVQEAAVHHWDALNAVGQNHQWGMWPLDAIDAVDEFLTHSVGNSRWPATDAAPMAGTIWFCPCYSSTAVCPAWYISDGSAAGTIEVALDLDEAATSHAVGGHGDPATFLLWLYRRVGNPAVFDMAEFDADGVSLVSRFRALSYTD